MIGLKSATDALLETIGRKATRSVALQLERPDIDMAGIPPERCWLEEQSTDMTVADVGQDDEDEWGYHVSLGVGAVLRNVTLRLELVDEAAGECRVRETNEHLLNGPRWKLSDGAAPDWAEPVAVTGVIRRTDRATVLEEGGRRWLRLG